MRLELNFARIEKIELAGSGARRAMDLVTLAVLRPLLPEIDRHLAEAAERAEASLAEEAGG